MGANSQTEEDEEMEENHNVEDMDVDTPTPPVKSHAINHLQQEEKFIQSTPKRSRKTVRNIPRSRPKHPTRQNHQNLSEDDDSLLNQANGSEDDEDGDDTMGEESKGASNNTTQTPPCSPVKSLNSSASPVGVNRR